MDVLQSEHVDDPSVFADGFPFLLQTSFDFDRAGLQDHVLALGIEEGAELVRARWSRGVVVLLSSFVLVSMGASLKVGVGGCVQGDCTGLVWKGSASLALSSEEPLREELRLYFAEMESTKLVHWARKAALRSFSVMNPVEAFGLVAPSAFWAVGLLVVRSSKTMAGDGAVSVLIGAAVWVFAGAPSFAVYGMKPGGRIAAFFFPFSGESGSMSMRVSLIFAVKSELDALLGWMVSWLSSQAWSPGSCFTKVAGVVAI